jgi:AcrR family transcriptional regulator
MSGRIGEMSRIEADANGKVKKKLKSQGRVAVRLKTHAQPLQADRKPETKKKMIAAAPRKRGDDVRERVLQAALECFGRFGFEGTSTRAVADQAKVTHTLVLYHFQSKDQLWIATMENALRPYIAAMKEAREQSKDAPASEGLKKFIEEFIHLSARYPQIHRILTTASNQETERLQWIIDHFLREHFTMVRDLIRRGQVEGDVRQCDPARLYYHIIGAGGTPYTLATEYKAFTGRDVFSEVEILRNIAFIYELVFI